MRRSSATVFLLITVIVVKATIKFYSYDSEFVKNLLVEAHGTLFDVLVECYFKNKMFDHLNLYGSSFEGANLEKVYLKESDLCNPRFVYSNLKGANFDNTGVWDVWFSDVNLENGLVHHSPFARAKFYNVNLKNSQFGYSFIDASLRNVDFEGAKLKKVNFENASLYNASLYNVNLQNAILSDVNFRGCSYDNKTSFPNWLNREERDKLGMKFIHKN